jgi:hypothetical protein
VRSAPAAPSLLAHLSSPQGNEPAPSESSATMAPPLYVESSVADPSAITTIHAPEPATSEPPTDTPRDSAIPARPASPSSADLVSLGNEGLLLPELAKAQPSAPDPPVQLPSLRPPCPATMTATKSNKKPHSSSPHTALSLSNSDTHVTRSWKDLPQPSQVAQ